jgi:S1-C subfamily serine protease
MVAGVSAIGASLLSTGLVLAVVGLRRSRPATPVAVERQLVRPRVTVAGSSVVEIAERARPAIVQIHNVREGSEVDGSAVLFSRDGHLLTNAHVVEGASSVEVILASGRSQAGRVVGSDPDTDSAVVKIDGGPFPVAELGTAGDLKVGQTAVAMGSPLALAGGPSVTVGVISALHRTVRTRSNARLFDMIQTDAPIAPGSSGGALFDGNGRVIGITTAVAVSDVGPEGLGFATPIDVARSVAAQLITTGRATHPWMGIEGNDLDGATAHDLSVDGGALVLRVIEGSPAATAGLAERDVIVRVDGKPVVSMGTLVAALRARRPGDVVALDVLRDGGRHTRSVTLAERPPNP